MILTNQIVEDKTIEHHLAAVLKHSGNGDKKSGHYIADIRIGESTWVRFNDDQVKQITISNVIDSSKLFHTCIAFYHRDNISYN